MLLGIRASVGKKTLGCALADVSYTGHANSVLPVSDASVRCSLYASNWQYTGRSGPVSDAANTSVWWVTLPWLLQTFHPIENKRFIFSKAPNPASQARSEGERNPNPSLPFKLNLLLKVCQHHHVLPTCASVLAFSQTFSLKELASQLAMPLDPNMYAMLDCSSGTRWLICKQVCLSW